MTELVWPGDYVNKIINADCLIAMKGIPDKAVDLILTDPPYGMRLTADWSGCKSNLKSAKEKGVFGGKRYDNVIGDDKDFDPTPIMNQFSYVKEQFWFGADYYCQRIPNISGGGWLVWDKRLSESADKMYGSGFELIWSKTPHKRDVLRFKWAGIFGTEKEWGKCRVHPNQKPIGLIKYLIEKYSKPNDLILDPFLGSGTTAVAAKELGRRFIGIEISPQYCSIAEKRLKYTEQPLF